MSLCVLFLDVMVPWRMEVCMLEMVWVMFSGWLSSCLAVADDIARALRSDCEGAVEPEYLEEEDPQAFEQGDEDFVDNQEVMDD